MRSHVKSPAAAEPDPASLRDDGLSLFAIFTVGMLVMVGLATLTAIVRQCRSPLR
jgi:hypothetical protein